MTQASFLALSLRTRKTVLLGEIGLYDVPSHSMQPSEMLFHTIVGNMAPVEMAEYLHYFGIIPQGLHDRITREAPRVGVEKTAEELDRALMHMLLHEIAEIYWASLSPRFQRAWGKAFPLEGKHSRSGIYYRNIIRLETERPENREDFFAQETFADALATYWGEAALPSFFEMLGNQGVVDQHRTLFDDLMNNAGNKREFYGTPFATNPEN